MGILLSFRTSSSKDYQQLVLYLIEMSSAYIKDEFDSKIFFPEKIKHCFTNMYELPIESDAT